MATPEQEPKAVVRRFFEAWNDADEDGIKEVVAADAKGHNPIEPSVPPSPEGEKQLMEMYHAAFSDATIHVEDVLAEGDNVAVRWQGTGTHEGEFMGIEPTGQKIEIVGFEIDRVVDGQIVESWGLFDAFGLMQQLGVVELPGE